MSTSCASEIRLVRAREFEDQLLHDASHRRDFVEQWYEPEMPKQVSQGRSSNRPYSPVRLTRGNKTMLRTLALLITVAQTTARANNAPVCAIGLKKGARVRLPGGARRASPALQIRVRKQLPIPITNGAHVAQLKNCRGDVGAFRQTCCTSRRVRGDVVGHSTQ